MTRKVGPTATATYFMKTEVPDLRHVHACEYLWSPDVLTRRIYWRWLLLGERPKAWDQ